MLALLCLWAGTPKQTAEQAELEPLQDTVPEETEEPAPLSPLNDVVESPLKPSRRIAAFQKRLESHGLTATVRRSLGGDIDASCGQLRRKEMEERKKGGMEA